MKKYTYVVTRSLQSTEVIIIKAESKNDADNMIQEMIDTEAIDFDASSPTGVEFDYDIFEVTDVEENE